MKFKNDIEKFEFFESVLNNKVSDFQEKEFEKALIDDDLLAKEFRDYQHMHELVIDNSVLEIEDTLASIHQKATIDSARGKGFPGWNFLLIITTGIIIIGTIILSLLRDPESKEAESGKPPEQKEQPVNSLSQQQMNTENKKSIQAAEKDNYKEEDAQPVSSGLKEQKKVTDTLQPEEKEMVQHVPVEDELTENKLKDNVVVVPRDSIDQSLNINPESESSFIEENAEEVDCEDIDITLNFDYENSCIEEVNSGRIIIDKKSIRGGTSPYYFSINGGNDYLEANYLFSSLSPGDYELLVRDMNQCEEKIAEIRIEEDICKKDYKYSPVLGEPWIIPAKKGKEGIFRLFSRTGQILVERRVNEFSDKTWYGRDDNNIPLNMGYFPFIIQYTDGEVFKGSVTLVK